MKFSQKFGIPHHQAALDFVDVDTAHDLPLFFDPNVFTNEEDPFCQACAESIRSFFATLIEAIQSKNKAAAIALLAKLNEPNEICLGWSKGRPSGRGVGRLQAQDLYDSLSKSEAARTGTIADLADCELFIDGIGPDKISDIAANIIRAHLAEYTKQQCELHGVVGLQTIPVGSSWSIQNVTWEQKYFSVPVVGSRPILLVPKRVVRWLGNLSTHHQKYYRHFVLNFLRDENLRTNSSLVHVLRNKKGVERRVVYKKDVEEKSPLSKDFLFRFSQSNPAVFEQYRIAYEKTAQVTTKELYGDFDTALFCDTLISHLKQIPPGNEDADAFHTLMIGVLEFIFFPHLSNPVKEAPIHSGRKRIDIKFVNCAEEGFFHWIHSHKKITAIWIMVECKNYSCDPANAELDQISSRFGANRGRVGILLARKFNDRARFLERCRDTVNDGRGWVIPLVDEDVVNLLRMIKDGTRDEVDKYLFKIFGELT